MRARQREGHPLGLLHQLPPTANRGASRSPLHEVPTHVPVAGEIAQQVEMVDADDVDNFLNVRVSVRIECIIPSRAATTLLSLPLYQGFLARAEGL